MTSPSGNTQSMQPFYNSIPQQTSFYLPTIGEESAFDRNGYAFSSQNVYSNLRNYYGYSNQNANFGASSILVSSPYIQPVRQFSHFNDCHQQLYETSILPNPNERNLPDKINNCNNSAFVDCNNMYASFPQNASNLFCNASYNIQAQQQTTNLSYFNAETAENCNDTKQLEKFAERFKHRRIKLGVTQSEVGNQLQMLKIPGIGSLSQSTICRFESLTLSHNNMMALKPVLETWLHWAENEEAISNPGIVRNDIASRSGIVGTRKRKRTSIGNEEKRTLELYFTMHPRPNSERIAQIAEKLELKKSVVRVWFCNQRQKQKRMKCCN